MGGLGRVALRCVVSRWCQYERAAFSVDTTHDGTGAARIFLPQGIQSSFPLCCQAIIRLACLVQARHSLVCRTVSSAGSDWFGAFGFLWLSKGQVGHTYRYVPYLGMYLRTAIPVGRGEGKVVFWFATSS